MHLIYLIPYYTKWHYTEGFKDLFRNWKNFISFTLYFFSLGLLFKTWFAPFGRLNEEYQREFDAEVFFETLVANTMMRLVGFTLRTIVIVIGLLVLLLVIVFGPVVLALWTLAPFIVLSLFAFGALNLLP